MGLKFIGAIPVSPFTQAVADAAAIPPTGFARFKSGRWSTRQGRIKYHEGRDRIYATFANSTPPGFSNGLGFVDPLFTNTSPPNSVWLNANEVGAGISTLQNLWIDHFDEQTSAQRIFVSNGGGSDVQEVDPVTLIASAPPINSPAPNGNFRDDQSDIGVGSEGGWTSQASTALFFSGLTDGIPGETLSQGTDVYPDGLYLTTSNNATLTGSPAAQQFIWVDIRTRRAIGALGVVDINTSIVPIAFPAEVDDTSTNNAVEASIAGDEFTWGMSQFIPDADSTFVNPKGQVLQHSRLDFFAWTNPSPTDVFKIYVRFTDFNPFGVVASAGNPIRTHGRIRFTSRILAGASPMFDVVGADDAINPTDPVDMMYDPKRRRLLLFMDNSTSTDRGDIPAGATSSYIGFYATSAEITTVTAPAPRQLPKTNDIIDFECTASGDIGERTAGIGIDWSLARVTTRLETLTGALTPATTSTAANPPIDQSVPTATEGTLEVLADGVVLAETTDYTVDLSTGVITWVTDQSGAALVQASYEHKQTTALPAYGTLLTAQSETNSDGIAASQVAYPDDDTIVGEVDQLSTALT